MERSWHQEPSDEEDDDDREGAEKEPSDDVRKGDPLVTGEQRGEHDHGNDAKILKEKDADGEAPVGSAQFGPIGERFEYNGCAAEGDQAPQEDRGVRPEPCQREQRPGNDDRQNYLEAPAPKELPRDCTQVREGKLEPHEEEEHDNAELGEDLDLLPIMDEVQPRRADQEAGQKEADDARKPQRPTDEDHDDRGRQDDEEIPQEREWIHCRSK